MFRRSLIPILGLALAGSALAAPEAHGVVSRHWKNALTQLETSLWLAVPESTEGTEGLANLQIRTHVSLLGTPALRPGELEHFSLVAEYLNLGNGSSANVRVRLIPTQASWVYRDDTGPVTFERTVPVYGAGAYDVYFELHPVVRRRIVPPNTVTEIMVRKPGAEEMVRFAWTDPCNPARAPTRFSVEVWEVRPFWFDKLVVRTEVGEAEPGTARLDVSRNSGMIDPGYFFKDRKDYLVVLRIQRNSADYQAVWSDPVKVRFRYQGGDGGFRERFTTPFGDEFTSPPGSNLDRVMHFEELYERPTSRF